jgi:hypothetical protein
VQRYKFVGSGWGDLIAVTHFLDKRRALPLPSWVNGGRMAITQ